MAEFGGYHMPLWYETGVKHEHCSVITRSGIFDTSHMAVLTVSGPGSAALLQHCFTRDLERCIGKVPGPLSEGRCVYGLLLNEDGTVLDDAIISLMGPERFMVVVNSSMGATVANHLGNYSGGGVVITDHTDQIGKIDLQGPDSARILASLLKDPDRVLDDMIYFSFKGDIFAGDAGGISLLDGTPVLVSRTGYTGEFGFELYVKGPDTLHVWEALLDVGLSSELAVCGLASRDSLRTGALLPLSHQDIGDWVFANTPWSFVLPSDEPGHGFTKHFVGAEALALQSTADYTYGFAGYDPRKIPVQDDTVVLGGSGQPIGTVLTCTTDMAIGRRGERIISLATPESAGKPVDFQARGLSCGFIRTRTPCRIGEQVNLSAGRRTINVEIRDDIRPDRTARRPIQEMRR
jgi:aminomethyltransferase